MRVRVGLFAFLVPLAPGLAQRAPETARGHAQAAGMVSQRRARPDEFFAHPEALCKALNPVGIETRDWDRIGEGGNSPFMCESGHAAANQNITTLFRVSGDTGSRADVISIAVTITAPVARATGAEEFSRLVAALFHSIGLPEPPTLLRAIARRRYYLSRRPYGVVWFNFVIPDHPGYRRVFWFRLSKSGPG